MTGTADDKLLWNQKKGAIETFLGSMMPSAKMMSLYKPGHPAIGPITERVNNLLMKTMGLEHTLVVDIKGKTISAEDVPLAETIPHPTMGGVPGAGAQ